MVNTQTHKIQLKYEKLSVTPVRALPLEAFVRLPHVVHTNSLVTCDTRGECFFYKLTQTHIQTNYCGRYSA